MTEIQVHKSRAQFHNGASLTVDVSATTPQGGGAGHGAWAEVIITNHGMMTMMDEEGQKDRLVLKVMGDMELSLLGNALAWAGNEVVRLSGTGRIEPGIPPEDVIGQW
ncbi:hypothetical protein [Streptomyces sp. NPDC001774]